MYYNSYDDEATPRARRYLPARPGHPRRDGAIARAARRALLGADPARLAGVAGRAAGGWAAPDREACDHAAAAAKGSNQMKAWHVAGARTEGQRWHEGRA